MRGAIKSAGYARRRTPEAVAFAAYGTLFDITLGSSCPQTTVARTLNFRIAAVQARSPQARAWVADLDITGGLNVVALDVG